MKFTAFTILSIAGLVAAAADDWSSDSAASSSTGSAAAASTPAASTSGYNPTVASNSTASTPPASSFKAPSGISTSCSNFLTALDEEPAIQSCISPALTAVSSSSSPSISAVCSSVSSGKCSESGYYKFLTYFSGNCTDELVTNPNDDVCAIFDSLYVALPFQKAICTKDALGNWCATASSSNSTSDSAGVANAAQTPLSTSDGYPDPDAFSQKDILFLGYNSELATASLCTTCLQKILTIYFGHESQKPYPAGLNSSPLMSVQSSLWTAVQSKCPADFVGSAIANAGASPSTVNAATAFTPAKGAMAFMALLAGVVAL